MSCDPHHCDPDDRYSDFLEDDAIWDFDPSSTLSSPATTLGKRKSPEEEPCALASKKRTITTDSDEYEPYIIVSFFVRSLSLSESSERSAFLKARFRL
jgi:hypothetical protein